MNYSDNENFEFENSYELELGDELSPEFEFYNETDLETSDRSSESNELPYELAPEFEGNFLEERNGRELENQLRELTDEMEFGSWLKKLAQKGGQTALNYLNSSSGRQVTSSLGDIAKKTLSGLGTHASSWLGRNASNLTNSNIRNSVSQYANGAGQQLSQALNDRVPSFVQFATDTLKNITNELNSGMTPHIKPAIIRSAAVNYPLILQLKGKVYARPSEEFEFEQPSQGYSNELSDESEADYEFEEELNEMEEMELASELLSVRNDQELEMFLGSLFKKVKGAVSGFARSGLAKSLTGSLKSIAKKALPFIGGALGTAIPIPGVGSLIGSTLGKTAGNLFGLELEGLSGEDQEFEIAKAYVRLASNAAKRASRISGRNPHRASRYALVMSAKRHAPGILKPRARTQSRGYNRYYNSYQAPIFPYPYPQPMPFAYGAAPAPITPYYPTANDTNIDQTNNYQMDSDSDSTLPIENSNGEFGYTDSRW